MPFNSDLAVKVEDLAIHFRTTTEHDARGSDQLGALQRLVARRRNSEVKAVDGVSFEVERGTVFGVVGPNGAGKSTLLRAVAGIYTPTKGRIMVRGQITPMLSLGVGFNRELTGHDNIILGGLAQGLAREEIEDEYDAIVEFAGLGKALHRPMRTWSSGMFGRLGFALAAHMKPDVLIIDEALGAGDGEFKARCKERINYLCNERSCTVLIVTHGLDMIKTTAHNALWIMNGQLRQVGPAEEVVESYIEYLDVADDAITREEI